MPRTDHDRTVAMAGIFQAIRLVNDIARRGYTDPQDFQTCLASLLKISAESSEDVYGGIVKLHSGLSLLTEHLRNPIHMETSRYVAALLVLERKLAKHPDFLRHIRTEIEAISAKLSHFPVTDHTIVAALARIYSSTVSNLEPRIMVYGEPPYLNNAVNADRIRALLLAGIRAALMWRQSGGGRLTLLFRRKALLQEAQRLLSSPVQLS